MIALLMTTTPAHAEDVARFGLGDAIRGLVVGNDGGAWVSVVRPKDIAIARVAPGAAVVTSPVTTPLSAAAALGPDGAAWFGTDGDNVLVRADAAGALTSLDLGDGIGSAFATGPDGTLWVSGVESDALAHVTAQGVLARTPFAPTGCAHKPQLVDMTRAPDGAMWMSDWACPRLLRLAGDAVQSFPVRDDELPTALAADPAGGVWFTQDVQPVIGHADVGGAITRAPYDLRRGMPADIAAAPDGSAWFTVGTCTLGHVTGKAVAFVPAPIPARQLAFDAAGALWLASPARVVRTTTGELNGAGCDDTPPRVRIRPATGGTIRLAALRKGFRIEVPEAARISLMAGYGTRTPRQLERTSDHPRRYTFRVPKLWISRIAGLVRAGQRPRLTLFVDAVDREGNVATVGGELHVRR
ncbi:Vgb family protein [Solirubrobacter soli]|uniref:Vgb family protein n=1 Tax=Solirubrobacter soli TaxID=363832 RepID=UPI0012FB9BF4|nr:hypothetical protein [Solirubrobacter soli]